jgi:hypothetical protein
MNNEFEMILKEEIMAKFKVLPWHGPGETKENCKIPQSG